MENNILIKSMQREKVNKDGESEKMGTHVNSLILFSKNVILLVFKSICYNFTLKTNQKIK